VRKKGGESGEAGVGGDEVFRVDTAFAGFNTFFGAGSEKWRRRFYRQFLKITSLKSGDEKVRMKHRFHHLWSAGLGE